MTHPLRRVPRARISIMLHMIVAACLVNDVSSRKTMMQELPASEPAKLILCEHEDVDIVCPDGETIEILYANYGRTQSDVCTEDARRSNTSCTDESHTEKLRADCNGESVCPVGSRNSYWGDTCYGTFKYLEVDYVCAAQFPDGAVAAQAPEGSCQGGLCGTIAQLQRCWCDAQCAEFGDCCADYEDLCVLGLVETSSPTKSPPAATSAPTPAPTEHVPTSCKGQCGGENVEDGCWCDPVNCALLGDCCDDVVDVCEPPTPVPAAEGTVIRREVRLLPVSEQRRFSAAVRKTMENRGDNTSVFSDMGDDHVFYCLHTQEAFLGWHRMYLVKFERLLQEADRQNGNDGLIAIPYWKFFDEELQAKEVIPDVAYKYLNTLPDWMEPVVMQRTTLEEIDAGLHVFDADYALGQQVLDSLDHTEHWQFASGENRRYDNPNIEQPHNLVHGRLGFPMVTPAASYDILFWLLHCFVDFAYSSYLKINPLSQQQMEAHQLMREAQGLENLYHKPLIPFVLPGTNVSATHADLFDSVALGYDYEDDALLKRQPKQQKTAPTLAMFQDIDIAKIGNTYQLHVFVIEKSRVRAFQPPTHVMDFFTMREYAGSVSAIGRLDAIDRPPYNDFVPITKALLRQNLTRDNVELVTWCEDSNDVNADLVPIGATRVPRPFIIGPGFNDMEGSIGVNYVGDEFEIINIQDYLVRYGYLNSSLIQYGTFDEDTAEALKRFQEQYGIVDDGVCGPITKAAMLHPRDYDREITEHHQRHPALRESSPNATVTYFVGPSPHGLAREDIEEEVRASFEFWEPHVALWFDQVDDKAQADITVEWTVEWINEYGNVFPFDGRGLTLARGLPSTGVVLDSEEVWKLLVNEDIDPATNEYEFYLQPVLIHEIGHVIGLEHVDGLYSVMSPFYNPFVTELSEHDIEELDAVVGTPEHLVTLRPEFFE